MAGGNQLLDQVVITLRNQHGNTLPVLIDVYNNSLGRKWLHALNRLIQEQYHLEKNYCFLGFAQSDRTPEYICSQINASIEAVNCSNIDYQIDDHYTVGNTVGAEWRLDHDRMNQLHRYFEDLQGTADAMSAHYTAADVDTRWHIRQLNLLCHEYESLILSIRKMHTAPEWQRPSQLMCWLQAPRFELDAEDFELFGIETINRHIGGVYVGVNKAVGKHHWEVFCDEGRDSRVDELTTTTLRGQTLAAGDFDIEWARDPGAYPWQQQQLAEFRAWLIDNGFDPRDKSLTIGHPKVGQVNLLASFGTTNYLEIWQQLNNYMDVYKISTRDADATYTYRWSDINYQEQQTRILK
jgi:hypothetical protein